MLSLAGGRGTCFWLDSSEASCFKHMRDTCSLSLRVFAFQEVAEVATPLAI